MRTAFVVLTAVSLASLLWGCSQAVKLGVCPGIRVTYRNALLDKSKVVNMINPGGGPLFSVCMWAQGWDTSFRVANQLDIGPSVEVGWMELPRGFKPGENIYISADGYQDYAVRAADAGAN